MNHRLKKLIIDFKFGKYSNGIVNSAVSIIKHFICGPIIVKIFFQISKFVVGKTNIK
jgi:hypothetical protein